MSFKVATTTEFPQVAFQYVPQEILGENAVEDFPVLGGILSDLKHIWNAKGPCLEVRNSTTGRKVGSWTFGGVLRDSNTKISGVEELKRGHGRLPLLVVALDCPLSVGLLCIFDIFGSKVLRVVQIGEQITHLHVIDAGCDTSVLPESSPLKYFDGIIAIGTLGGNVFLVDLCKQICENAIQNMDVSVRDEVNPCQMAIVKKEKIGSIKRYVERAMEQEEHLAIHLNVVLNPSTEHFTLKGENNEDRVHVNRSEAEVSALFYSSQIASVLVGYNFGAFQMWDLRMLDLLYTSPICEGHIPVTHFTVQEPADDPKAYCYIWVTYSHNLLFHSGLPFAVMYSFYFDNKKFVNGYGNLYEDFQHCSIRFQLELGDTQSSTCKSRVKGGTCLGLQSINKSPTNKDLSSLALCLISWLIWDSNEEVNTAVLLFDLNQWYKEQMPRMPNWSHCSNYIIKNSLAERLLDVKMDQRSLSQFMGIQRLEEHFCPTALSFDLWGITEDSITKIHNKGLQRAFLDKIVGDQHLALVRPEDYSEQIVALGLVPLFCDVQINNATDFDYQREILLSVALEQKLVGWLCQATAKLANNAFNASGLTIYNMLHWAFQRAIAIKSACDKYCVPLFDYSGRRLDDNIITLISCGTGQIRNLCSFYGYVSSKLPHFVPNLEGFLEERRSLENTVVYFEVLLWMVNVGLLPEYQPRGAVDSLLGAPYLVQDLTQYYSGKRAQLQAASRDTFVEKDCLLFIDNMINYKGGAEILRQQWQEDGGSGLYPPPSLQSVLRTYFLNGPDLVFKHSLVTYTLLDVAMTVDEHNKVIKLLLKFPQIFDLTQSHIKIVQAFWHLDHDDYETALESILDPCVLLEDLQHWHHSVMMRSLLLQDQSSLALLYLQVRKPSIQDEKDLLTVISLLISKNMLDEAFKFRLHHKGPNEQTLLTHIFDECNRNEQLHSVLYRRLNTDEERAFFRYLQNARNPRCEDLKVFYYLLRSRFLEAFDSYSSTRRRQPDTQGLVGQRDASTADNVVKMFKALLPDVNRNLVELVRKERSNLWKEVRKPTPLSVFVHNARDQVHYKSSVIFAALSKAKQTFSDTLNDTRMGQDVMTEDTPFLRTPTVFRSKTRADTPLLRSKVIEQNELGEEYGPSPCKKLKLSPRMSTTSPVKSGNLPLSAKLSTPIVKRKRQSQEQIDTPSVLPQSILKSRTLLDDSIFDENTSVNTSLQAEYENSIRRSRLGLTPRKAVGTPLKTHVKFDDLRYSGSSAEQSSSAQLDLTDGHDGGRSRNSTGSAAEDTFYSPEASFETGTGKQDDASTVEDLEEPSLSAPITITQSKERSSFDETIGKLVEPQEAIPRRVPVEENDLSTNRMNFQSPRARRSYKRSFGSESPASVRSSPRLAKKLPVEDTTVPPEPKLESSTPPSSPSVQKLRGRKSLSRSVLEHNAFAALKSSTGVLPEERKSYGRRSVLSSLNTTLNFTDSDTDVSTNHDDSFDAFLEKYRYVPANSSLDASGSDSFRQDEVVSKTTEVSSVETRRESLRKRDTGALVSSNETTDTLHSKTVEVFGEEITDKPLSESRTETSTQDTVSEEDAGPQTTEPFDDDAAETSGKAATPPSPVGEVNVYDDLSSGSEDVRQILEARNDTETEKSYADTSFSTSLYQTERHELEMPVHILDSEESSSSNDEPESALPQDIYENDVEMLELDEEPPVTEKAFIDSGEVIEIASSSEERSSDYSSSSSANQSYSSNDSVRGSNVSNKSYELNVRFEDNLNEDQETEEAAPRDLSAEVEAIEEASSANPDRQVEVESDEEHMDCLLLEDQESVGDDGQQETQIEERRAADVSPPKTSDETCGNENMLSRTVLEVLAKVLDVDSTSPEKHSISVQCSLEGSALETTDPQPLEVEETPKTEKHSISLQCTIAAHDQDAPEAELEDSLDTPTFKLKTVKKTYRGRTPLPYIVNIDATPKLAVDLTRRTYSRKDPISQLFQGSQTGAEDGVEDRGDVVPEYKQEGEQVTEGAMEVDRPFSEKEDPEAPVVDQEPGGDKDRMEEDTPSEKKDADAPGVDQEPGGDKDRMEEDTPSEKKDADAPVVDQKPGGDKDPMVEDTPSEKKDANAPVVDQKPRGDKDPMEEDTPSEKKDAEEHKPVAAAAASSAQQTNAPAEEDATEVEAAKPAQVVEPSDGNRVEPLPTEPEPLSSDQEKNKTMNKEETELEQPKAEAAPIRVTRRRSMLLSQQEAASNSGVSEESVTSTATKSTKSGDFDQSGAGTSQSTTSQSSWPSRLRKNRSLSESMFDETMLGVTPEKLTLESMKIMTKLRNRQALSESLFDATMLADTPEMKDRIEMPMLKPLRPKAESGSKKTDLSESDAPQPGDKPAGKKRSSRKLLSDVDTYIDTHADLEPSAPAGTKTRRSSKTSKSAGKPASRTRSASMDHLPFISDIRVESGRSKSIDLDHVRAKKDQKISLAPISEVPDTSTEASKHKSKASSHLGDYSTSRRLTRRQANMLETIGNVEKEMQKFPIVDELDPLHLLDKSEFEGNPDPEESKVYEPSSPSDSSGTLSRHTRGASVLSDATSASTPTKKRSKAKVVHVDSPVSGIKSRLRRPSTDTMSVTSEQSESPSPPKRSRKKETEEEHKTRRRTGSVSSTKSAASDKTDTSVRTTRSRRLHSAKSELPEIQEEKGSDEDDSAPSTTKKGGRKRK